LLYSSTFRRLTAIELKLGEFETTYKGKPGEEIPIGIILCVSANREIIEKGFFEAESNDGLQPMLNRLERKI